MSFQGASCLLISPRDLPLPEVDIPATDELQTAILAGGCFWCTEAVFLELKGVQKVVSGYIGGTAETADYRTVCSGMTGHAEAIAIDFDPREITYGQLLRVFFSVAHDPTQLNRQGADQGTQYRSAIFPLDDQQAEVARLYMQQLTAANVFNAPLKTTIESGQTLYPAETYHQNYARQNPTQPYIAGVSQPKVEKLRTYFSELLQ